MHPNEPLPVFRTVFGLLGTGDKMGEHHLQKEALRLCVCPHPRSSPTNAISGSSVNAVSLASSYARFTKHFGSVVVSKQKRSVVSVKKSRGNENRRRHGARRKLNIGDKRTTTFCVVVKYSPSCVNVWNTGFPK